MIETTLEWYNDMMTSILIARFVLSMVSLSPAPPYSTENEVLCTSDQGLLPRSKATNNLPPKHTCVCVFVCACFSYQRERRAYVWSGVIAGWGAPRSLGGNSRAFSDFLGTVRSQPDL